MANRDTGLISWVDVPAAIGLLTRLPIPVDGDQAKARGAGAAWAYPLVGIVVGVIAAAATGLMLYIGLPAGIVAALVMAVTIILTGAMHEDGLADSADGLWGGWDRARRLTIMKDSRIGVYGVTSIALSLLVRWLALVVIVATGTYWSAFIAIGAVSRGAMLLLMWGLPNARANGLSHTVGQPGIVTLCLGLGMAAVTAIVTGYPILIIGGVCAALVCGAIAKVKIGGQTGDILGATQQITELVLLLMLVARFS